MRSVWRYSLPEPTPCRSRPTMPPWGAARPKLPLPLALHRPTVLRRRHPVPVATADRTVSQVQRHPRARACQFPPEPQASPRRILWPDGELPGRLSRRPMTSGIDPSRIFRDAAPKGSSQFDSAISRWLVSPAAEGLRKFCYKVQSEAARVFRARLLPTE